MTEYDFLSELATIQQVPGFPPALFTPASQPSRFEIAFFLYRLDQHLEGRAEGYGLDLKGVLRQTWLAINPDADPAGADAWAEMASTRYRRLLIEYNHEMAPLGFRLRPDAYPDWSGVNDDALGH